MRTAGVQLIHGSTFLDRDFMVSVITSRPEDVELGEACLEIHPVLHNHQALMLTLPRSLFSSESSCYNREIVFVADRSGSMEDKIERLKSAMEYFIKGLPKQLCFNIWCYGTGNSSLWPKSMPLTDSTMQEAIEYVRSEFAANMGGTEILPVIKKVHKARNYKLSHIDVLILTDGEICGSEATITYIREWRQASEGKARFFTLGVGQGASHELVQGIAKAGGGSCELVTSDPKGPWEDRVVTLLKAARTDHISSINIDLQWQGGHLPEPYQSPADLSSISPFHRNRIYFLLDDQSAPLPRLEQVVVHITGTDGTIKVLTMHPRLLSPRNDTIHLLAVRSLLEDVSTGESCLHQAKKATITTNIESIATNLAIKWSLISKWTSMYAVEETKKQMKEDTIAAVEVINDDSELQAGYFPQGNQNFLTLKWTETTKHIGEGNIACSKEARDALGAGPLVDTSATGCLGPGASEKRIGVASLLRHSGKIFSTNRVSSTACHSGAPADQLAYFQGGDTESDERYCWKNKLRFLSADALSIHCYPDNSNGTVALGATKDTIPDHSVGAAPIIYITDPETIGPHEIEKSPERRVRRKLTESTISIADERMTTPIYSSQSPATVPECASYLSSGHDGLDGNILRCVRAPELLWGPDNFTLDFFNPLEVIGPSMDSYTDTEDCAKGVEEARDLEPSLFSDYSYPGSVYAQSTRSSSVKKVEAFFAETPAPKVRKRRLSNDFPTAKTQAESSGKFEPNIFNLQDDTSISTLITLLLGFQTADGSFIVPRDVAFQSTLSPNFFVLIDRLESQIRQWQVSATIAIIALLQVGYPKHSGFWDLMVSKAKDYLKTDGARFNVEVLMEEAWKFVELAKVIEIKKPETQEPDASVLLPVEELLVAPLLD